MVKRACPICRKIGRRTEWTEEVRKELDNGKQFFRDEVEIKEVVCRTHPGVRKEIGRKVVLRGLL